MGSKPQLLFGGSGIGEGRFVSQEEVRQLLENLVEHNVTSIDTAAAYPLGNPFHGETLLGSSGFVNNGLKTDTKILLAADFTGNTSLEKEKINFSVEGSFNRLRGKINTLYCHMPDGKTPMAETAEALDCLHKKGLFTSLGLCNHTPDLIKELLAICDSKGYIKPSVYQGQYNALHRGDEDTFIPFLRELGISYVAHSPLAGGFLSGKLTSGADLTGTRFEEGTIAGPFLRATYDNPTAHEGVKLLQKGLEPHGLNLTDASLRWIFFHSALKINDGVILGGSSMAQVKANMAALQAGPLNAEIVSLFDEAWGIVKQAAV